MASNLLNKYVWLAETIYRARQITFDEINEKWLDSSLSDGVPLPLRTFHKWRVAVEEMFGLVIDCKRKGGYHYFIENIDDLKDGNIRSWLLNTMSVSNLLVGNQQLKDRILLEEIPSGQEYLAVIIEAMKHGHTLIMTYQSYWREHSSEFEVEPYCVKLFKQRWYVVGRTPYYDRVRIYSLDRILELNVITDRKFSIPETFSPKEYFEDCYGVIAGSETDVENVKLKISSHQAHYIRAVPLHHSQQEVERTEDFSVFTLRLRPTSDFVQEILWNGENAEVLEPLWLREEIAGKIRSMLNVYRTK